MGVCSSVEHGYIDGKGKGKESQEVIYVVGRCVRMDLNVRKTVLLATCLVEGGSQRGTGVVLIQVHVRTCHGGSVFRCVQKTLIQCSCRHVDFTYISVLRGVEA